MMRISLIVAALALFAVACSDTPAASVDSGTVADTGTGRTDVATADVPVTTTDVPVVATDVQVATDVRVTTDVATDAAPGPVTCAEYCTLVTSTCGPVPDAGRSDAIYFDNAGDRGMGACMTVCAAWSTAGLVGTRGEASGNTLSCRFYHVTVASSMTGSGRTNHCLHSGLLGGDGTNTGAMNPCTTTVTNDAGSSTDVCTAFCSTMQAVCTGTNMQYADLATCQSNCAAYSRTVPYSVGAAGNNLACRAYHLTAAASSAANATSHCAHASMSGGGVCVSS